MNHLDERLVVRKREGCISGIDNNEAQSSARILANRLVLIE